MIDFEVQKFTRRCAATDRELAPGETFYSVLVLENGEVVRRDYSSGAWEGPPEDAIAFWRSEVPDPRAKRMQLAPSDVMLQYLESLLDDRDQKVLVYVLTLLMIRRRILKLEASERFDDGREVMLVYCPRNEKEYQIEVQTPDPMQVSELQQRLSELLFATAD